MSEEAGRKDPVIADNDDAQPSAEDATNDNNAETNVESELKKEEGSTAPTKRTREEGEYGGQEKKIKVSEEPTATNTATNQESATPVPMPLPNPNLDASSIPPPQETIEIRVLMQAKWMGGLIGKGGSVIKEYRSGSEAYINISSSVPGVKERIVTVKGAPKNVMTGLQLVVQNLVTQMVASATYYPQNMDEKDSGGPYVTFLVPNAAAGAVIGKAGTVVKQVRETTGASIKISDDLLPASTDKSLQIRGTYEQIWAAAEILLNNVTASRGWSLQNTPYNPQPPQGYYQQQYPGAPYNPGEAPTQVVLPVPKTLVGSIIGKRGANIQEIRQRSGATVKIGDAQDGTQERMISITGTRDQHQLALSLIYAKMNEQAGAAAYMPPAHSTGAAGATDPTVLAQMQAAQMAAYQAAYSSAYSGYRQY